MAKTPFSKQRPAKENSKKPKRVRAPRPYGHLLDSLRKVWRIHSVDADPFWFRGRSELDLLPRTFRVGVWNVCKGAGGHRFEHDYRYLTYQCHLVLLQEVLVSKRSIERYAGQGMQLCHAGSYERSDLLRDGVLTASKAGFQGAKVRVTSRYSEPLFGTPKISLVSFHQLQDARHKLMIVNMHATAFRAISRARKEIRHLIEQLPRHDGPILFCGDFNTFTKTYLKAICEELQTIGLIHLPIQDDPRAQSGYLDHIFVRGLKPLRGEVLTTIRSSDHFPLYFELQLENAEPN